ncbi:hypothetical protein GEMRC1_013448 [Eukaryota sp. GEM-RC1]
MGGPGSGRHSSSGGTSSSSSSSGGRSSSSSTSSGSKSSSGSHSSSKSSTASQGQTKTTPTGRVSHAGEYYYEKSDHTIDHRSAAYRSGDIQETSSGGISRTSAAVRRGDASVTQSGGLDHRRLIAQPTYTAPKEEKSILYDSEGNIKKTSGVARSGEMRFTQDDEPDLRSSMFRQNKARLTKEGEFDHRYRSWTDAEHSISPEELRTGLLRDSYAQEQYRKAHPNSHAYSMDVSHTASLLVALESLKHRRGPHLTEQQIRNLAQPIVNHPKNFRMVASETNREHFTALERGVVAAMKDPNIPVTKEIGSRAATAACTLQVIADDLRSSGNEQSAHEAERWSAEYLNIAQRAGLT